MSTKEEREDINELPLVPVTIQPVKDYVTNCPAEQVLDNVLAIDSIVQKIQTDIAPYLTRLGKQREELMQRAIKEELKEGTNAVMIVKKGKEMRNKITDLDAFELQFPDEYKVIRNQQARDIGREWDTAIKRLYTSEIPLGLADEICGKKAVTEFVGVQPVKLSYEVQEKKRK